MLTISKAKSVASARAYYRGEYANAGQNYYTGNQEINGEWHGRLAKHFGLVGNINSEQYERLLNGQHAISGEQLIKKRDVSVETIKEGVFKLRQNRAGWDATISAPKSVSLQAIVAKDERVFLAHRQAVDVALNQLERFAQARMGGNKAALTTSNLIIAKFHHDSDRPVMHAELGKYAAPQLHTHSFIMNMTMTNQGTLRSLQPIELFRAQSFITSVYYTELAERLQKLGLQIERGEHNEPQIAGYSKEYLAANSLRRSEIVDYINSHGAGLKRGWAEATQIAATATRNNKLTPAEMSLMQEKHLILAAKYGNEPQHIYLQSQIRGPVIRSNEQEKAISSVNYSLEKHSEREAVFSELKFLRDAYLRHLGEVSRTAINAEINHQISNGQLIVIKQTHSPANLLTTAEMIKLEQENINRVLAGQMKYQAIASQKLVTETINQHQELNSAQRLVVKHILNSKDQIIGLQGDAGTGKSFSLRVIANAAQKEGYQVQGFAPTGRAANSLAKSDITTTTLQKFLASNEIIEGKRLYILDESSLASSRDIKAFFDRVGNNDRVILVGDIKQHESVAAGRMFAQLQQSGMAVARLEEIIRQQNNPKLRSIVEDISHQRLAQGIKKLIDDNRVIEIANENKRVQAIIKDFVKSPTNTLIISPTNNERHILNEQAHNALKTLNENSPGRVSKQEFETKILVNRQELTVAEKSSASSYQIGDVIHFAKGSQVYKIPKGSYGVLIDKDDNLDTLTVKLNNGEIKNYNTERLHGSNVYRVEGRNFAVGDRIQFRQPINEKNIANGELGIIKQIDHKNGQAILSMDSGKTTTINLNQHQHIDYGYAVTSFSSQSETAYRVLINVDTHLPATIVNQRMAYVAISRASHEVSIYTDNKNNLSDVFDREYNKSSALKAIEANTSIQEIYQKGLTIINNQQIELNSVEIETINNPNVTLKEVDIVMDKSIKNDTGFGY